MKLYQIILLILAIPFLGIIFTAFMAFIMRLTDIIDKHLLNNALEKFIAKMMDDD